MIFGKNDNLTHVVDLNYAQLLIFICIIVTYVILDMNICILILHVWEERRKA